MVQILLGKCKFKTGRCSYPTTHESHNIYCNFGRFFYIELKIAFMDAVGMRWECHDSDYRCFFLKEEIRVSLYVNQFRSALWRSQTWIFVKRKNIDTNKL